MQYCLRALPTQSSSEWLSPSSRSKEYDVIVSALFSEEAQKQFAGVYFALHTSAPGTLPDAAIELADDFCAGAELSVSDLINVAATAKPRTRSSSNGRRRLGICAFGVHSTNFRSSIRPRNGCWGKPLSSTGKVRAPRGQRYYSGSSMSMFQALTRMVQKLTPNLGWLRSPTFMALPFPHCAQTQRVRHQIPERQW